MKTVYINRLISHTTTKRLIKNVPSFYKNRDGWDVLGLSDDGNIYSLFFTHLHNDTELVAHMLERFSESPDGMVCTDACTTYKYRDADVTQYVLKFKDTVNVVHLSDDEFEKYKRIIDINTFIKKLEGI